MRFCLGQVMVGLWDLGREGCGAEGEPRPGHSRGEQAVEALWVFSSHASSSTSRWCVTPPVSPGPLQLILDHHECISHLQDCLLPKRVSISWLFGSCPSDCSSHLCVFELLCRSWWCSERHHLFHSLFHIQTKFSVLAAGTYTLLAEECQCHYYDMSSPLRFLNATCMLAFSKGWLFFQVAGACGFLVWGLLY